MLYSKNSTCNISRKRGKEGRKKGIKGGGEGRLAGRQRQKETRPAERKNRRNELTQKGEGLGDPRGPSPSDAHPERDQGKLQGFVSFEKTEVSAPFLQMARKEVIFVFPSYLHFLTSLLFCCIKQNLEPRCAQ